MTEAGTMPALSALIETALVDYRGLDRSLYQAHSDYWHFAYAGDKTLVGLEGAFMAGTLSRSAHDSLTLDDFSGDDARKLHALNYVSRGRIRDALSYIGVDIDGLTKERLSIVDSYDGYWENNWCPYSNWTNWDEVEPAMARFLRLARDLNLVGL